MIGRSKQPASPSKGNKSVPPIPEVNKTTTEDNKNSARDSDPSPRANDPSPRGTEPSPRGNEYSPRGNEPSPRDNEYSPRGNEHSLRDDRHVPLESSPLAGGSKHHGEPATPDSLDREAPSPLLSPIGAQSRIGESFLGSQASPVSAGAHTSIVNHGGTTMKPDMSDPNSVEGHFAALHSNLDTITNARIREGLRKRLKDAEADFLLSAAAEKNPDVVKGEKWALFANPEVAHIITDLAEHDKKCSKGEDLSHLPKLTKQSITYKDKDGNPQTAPKTPFQDFLGSKQDLADMIRVRRQVACITSGQSIFAPQEGVPGADDSTQTHLAALTGSEVKDEDVEELKRLRRQIRYLFGGMVNSSGPSALMSGLSTTAPLFLSQNILDTTTGLSGQLPPLDLGPHSPSANKPVPLTIAALNSLNSTEPTAPMVDLGHGQSPSVYSQSVWNQEGGRGSSRVKVSTSTQGWATRAVAKVQPVSKPSVNEWQVGYGGGRQ